MVACPNSCIAQFRGNSVFYRSATSGWSLEVSVYAELTVAVVGIVSQQNINLFIKNNSRIVALTFHMRTKQKVYESKKLEYIFI